LSLALLVSAGLLSLRKDRLLAESEARDRAVDLAGRLAAEVSRELSQPPPLPDLHLDRTTNTIAAAFLDEPLAFPTDPRTDLIGLQSLEWDACRVWYVSQNAQLASPKSRSVIPTPQPIDQTGLEVAVRSLRQKFAAIQVQDLEQARTLIQEVFDRDASDAIRAAALFQLALQFEQDHQSGRAFDILWLIQWVYPDQLSASGLPFGQLALARLVPQAVKQPDLMDSSLLRKTLGRDPSAFSTNDPKGMAYELIQRLCSQAVYVPTAISPQLLALAETCEKQLAPVTTRGESVPDWKKVWLAHEAMRRANQAYQRALRSPDSNSPYCLWANIDGQQWLIQRLRTKAQERDMIFAQSERRVNQILQDTLADNPRIGRIPSYLTPAIEIAGNPLKGVTHSSAVLARYPLAESKPAHPAAGAEYAYEPLPIGVVLHLTDPAGLYYWQRQRSLWFGLLIVLAAGTALYGFAAAYRAFRRQLRLNQMKSNFVSSVSHELRAPIASIRLLAEGLARGRVSTEEKKTEYFGFIVQECRRLAGLIENVLDFSRIEQGRKQYEFEPVDPIALVRQTQQLMEPSAGERQIQLEVKINEAQWSQVKFEICWDGRAIQQALINLIDNAIKHSASGQTVTIGLDLPEANPADPPGNGSLHLWVEDQGEGIPLEEQNRIFERFYRSGSELRRRTEGVGIGLSIVKHIVEAHGGHVRVQSQPEHGSRFTLELPHQCH
jgi:signal transduction histidine kinase